MANPAPTKHTPTPYSVGNTHQDNGQWVTTVLDANGDAFMEVFGSTVRDGYSDEANSWEKAEAFVCTCNAHDELVEFLEKQVKSLCFNTSDGTRGSIYERNMLRDTADVLAKARGDA